MNINAQKWVKSLRSGVYAQANGRLRTEEGYCCLGVACDLYIKEHEDTTWEALSRDDPRHMKAYSCLCGFAYLPNDVINWLRLTSDSGIFTSDDGGWGRTSLTEQNDNGKSFKEIADLIEEYEDQLFHKEDENV